MSDDAQNYTESRYNIMGFNKNGVHKKYKFEIIEHPIFGEIRTAIINGKRYYSSKDIGKSLNIKAPSSGATRHLRDASPAQYIVYKRLSDGHTSYLRVIPIDEVLFLISDFRSSKQARELLRWLLSTISDQFNYD